VLKTLGLTNLGTFGDYDYTLNLNKETVIVGPNNAGKSQLFIALNLLKDILYSGRINYNTKFYNINSFQDAVYLHDRNRTIRLEASFKEDNSEYKYQFTINSDGHFGYEFYENGTPKEGTERAELTRISYENPKHFEIIRKI
jgi:AAA15 family ATPase/GTPase